MSRSLILKSGQIYQLKTNTSFYTMPVPQSRNNAGVATLDKGNKVIYLGLASSAYNLPDWFGSLKHMDAYMFLSQYGIIVHAQSRELDISMYYRRIK